jgi:hypothetical protein
MRATCASLVGGCMRHNPVDLHAARDLAIRILVEAGFEQTTVAALLGMTRQRVNDIILRRPPVRRVARCRPPNIA